MSRTKTLTDAQRANVEATATRPVYVMRIKYGAAEELVSFSGEIIYAGETYYPAVAMQLGSIEDYRSAKVAFSPTNARIAECLSGAWRGGACLIYYIPAATGDDGNYTAAEGILIMDGIITASSYTGTSVNATITHTNLVGNYTPRNIAEEFSSNILPPGSILSWESESVVLKSKA